MPHTVVTVCSTTCSALYSYVHKVICILTRRLPRVGLSPVHGHMQTRRPASADRTARANFRLLANQWAKRRLVTQWRHGCRAMRRSVCNADASNAGWSLCVQISRERSYLLPIYWYHSKGNWLHYNFAAESFYVMKLSSRLFVLYCRNCPKDDKFR